MKEKNYTGTVPDQESGAAIDATSCIEFRTAEEAKAFFPVARERLLYVNGWHKIAGAISATFQLTDENGIEVDGPVKEGYYFKIDIPGPGTSTGGGYDWVIVESVENVSTPDVESVGVRVRPASNPTNKDEDIAHFYSESSTSSFTITREVAKVTAAIYDRNTQINKEASGVIDKIRDSIVGSTGIAAFSKLQWKMLADALIKAPPD